MSAYGQTRPFRKLRAKQIRAEAEGGDAMPPEMRQFIEEAKASGVTRCPIRDIEEKASKCPVDFKMVSAADAKAAMENFMKQEAILPRRTYETTREVIVPPNGEVTVDFVLTLR